MTDINAITGQCIPSRINTLTAWGVVGASTWALVYTVTPAIAEIAAGMAIGAAVLGVTLAGRRVLQSRQVTGGLKTRKYDITYGKNSTSNNTKTNKGTARDKAANAEDWLADIRRKPAKLRGEGTAVLLTLPAPAFSAIEQEATNDAVYTRSI